MFTKENLDKDSIGKYKQPYREIVVRLSNGLELRTSDDPYYGIAESREETNKNLLKLKCKTCKKDMIPELAYNNFYCGVHCYNKGSKH